MILYSTEFLFKTKKTCLHFFTGENFCLLKDHLFTIFFFTCLRIYQICLNDLADFCRIPENLPSVVFKLKENCAPTLWQYGLWSFQTGGTKLKRFLHKNQHTQRKLLNFEFWINGELSKIGHHFSNKVI